MQVATPSVRTSDPTRVTAAPAWDVYAEGVRLMALRALGDTSAAADVAQEVVTRAMTALAEGRGGDIGDLGAFIYGIARHCIVDALRAAGRTIPLDALAEAAEPALDALSAAIAEEDRHRVRAALQELSPRDREVIRLSYFESLDAEEIARRLGERPVNVRKRKSRALERLRRAFLGGHKSGGRPTDT